MKKAVSSGIFLAVYILLFFISGYHVGKNPQFYKETIVLGNALPRIYIDHELFFNSTISEKLKKIAHVDFEISKINPEQADIWITQYSFLDSTSAYNLKYHQLENKFISPDFKLHDMYEHHALPLAWRLDKSTVKIIVLTAPIQNRTKQTRSIQMLLQSLLSKEFQLEMIQNSEWNTPLQSIDEMNINKDRKASAIRQHSLLKTKIE